MRIRREKNFSGSYFLEYQKRMGEEKYIMAHKIGFIKEDYESKETELKREVVREETIARKSVVQVYLPDRDRSYSYYNDQFDLQCGDIVFVEGKLEGVRGRVTATYIQVRRF